MGAARHLGPDVLAPHVKGEERGDGQHLAGAARGDRHEEGAGDQDDACLAHQRIGAGRQHQVVKHLVNVDLEAHSQRRQLPSEWLQSKTFTSGTVVCSRDAS